MSDPYRPLPVDPARVLAVREMLRGVSGAGAPTLAEAHTVALLGELVEAQRDAASLLGDAMDIYNGRYR